MKKTLLCTAIAALLPFGLGGCFEQKSEAVALEKPANESVSGVNPLETAALDKISTLEAQVKKAQVKGLDVTREETTLWFAREFLKFANWDEQNRDAVAYMFGAYAPYEDRKEQLAEELPDFERSKVIEILDASIEELGKVIDGSIKRRPVPKIDWENIEVSDNMLLSNGKPAFLYDYFSKSVGRPLTDTAVYNDHLGAIYHGGENLYPVDHDRAINSFLLKEDGTFDDMLMKEVTDIDPSNVGFLIYWNMGIPEWVEKKEPEVRLGRSLFTGYDIDNPLVRDVWGKIASHTGELTRGKKVTQLGYILANEPHWFSEKGHWSQNFQEMNAISSYTLNAFRNWLDGKYQGDIKRLNANWDSDYSGFDSVQIEIPIDPAIRGTAQWYDWSRYNMDRAINWFTFLQGELRKGNPEADTSIKIMPDMFTENSRSHGIDVEALTDLTSMIGNDAKTRETRALNRNQAEHWEAHYSWFWEEMSMSYDFMESVSPGKIHVNSESHFLSASWWRDLNTSVDYVHSVYWLATLQGMDANMAWFWARDPDGSPEDRLEGEMNFFDPALAGSFAGSVNQQPHVANAYTQVMYDLNSFSEEIVALREQRRPIRLFYSETSAINKPKHMSEQWKAYEGLFFEGFPVGFATENIINKQDHSQWDVIVVHSTEYVSVSELAALQSYLNTGGAVIVDNAESLSMDEYGKPHKKVLEQGEGKLIVLNKKNDVAAMREAALNVAAASLPSIKLVEENGTNHKGTTWRVVQQDDGSYLVSILNIGKHKAKLDLSLEGSDNIAVTDLFTENEMGPQFELEPKGVLLLKVSAG
ncbi:glycoside hydrolase family 42 [Microbulbifer agarilyticus]|uniref:glycoside hydrolase family 42 n=1 Tax=Microbulbifer agarilyticus TaxID=260552 RepID=UPI001C940A4D|nr:glycoside hydrolase family 42 [Microbulbifer agarilyticus]MBY6212010.1 glycoside hydrolase family 42 [Microbulbifer agarilyticus]